MYLPAPQAVQFGETPLGRSGLPFFFSYPVSYKSQSFSKHLSKCKEKVRELSSESELLSLVCFYVPGELLWVPRKKPTVIKIGKVLKGCH